MTRRVITVSNQATGTAPVDSYAARIVKYVPADIVAAWLALVALLSTGNQHRGLLWAVWAFLLVITPAWTLRMTRMEGKPPAWVQAVVSTVAFAIWVFASGAPFSWLEFYDPVFGGVALILFTLASGLITSSKADEPTRSEAPANPPPPGR
jgi:hypothetical protein